MRTGVSPAHQNLTLSFIFVYLMSACFHIYNYTYVLVHILTLRFCHTVIIMLCIISSYNFHNIMLFYV
jgi:hypothetical protein